MTTKPADTDATDPDSPIDCNVTVGGGGVAGLSAAVFTARRGLDTVAVDSGESILRRNAHQENFPGFPAGVNARRLLDLLGEQAEAAGCEEIDEGERRDREARSLETMRDRFAEPHPAEQETHPSLTA